MAGVDLNLGTLDVGVSTTYVDNLAQGLTWVTDKETSTNEADIIFDSDTNAIQIKSGQDWITLDSGNGLTYSSMPSVTYNTNTTNITNPNEGDYLVFDGNNMQWTASTASAYSGGPCVWNEFSIFDNDEISIEIDGSVMIGGKKELNPSKIGLALLRAISNKNESKQKLDSMEDICDG